MSSPTQTRRLPGDERGRVICSARPHSRSIDSIGAVRPFLRYGCKKPGGRSKRPESKRWLQMRLASQIPRPPGTPASVARRTVLQQRASAASDLPTVPQRKLGRRQKDDHRGRDPWLHCFHPASETPASPKVATSVRTRTAASTIVMASAAPVPSPSLRSRSMSGFFPRRSSAATWPRSTLR